MLTIHVAEVWEPQDYLNAISAVETIYYISMFHQHFEEYANSSGQRRRLVFEDLYWDRQLAEFLGAARMLADGEQRLLISRISHASPGLIDFEGLGKVAEAMDSALGRIIDVFTGRRLRRARGDQADVQTDILRENLNTIKIENARRLLELERDFPGSYHRPRLEKALVSEQTKIEDLAARGLITDQRDHPADDKPPPR